MNRTCMFDPTTILVHYLTKRNRKMSYVFFFYLLVQPLSQRFRKKNDIFWTFALGVFGCRKTPAAPAALTPLEDPWLPKLFQTTFGVTGNDYWTWIVMNSSNIHDLHIYIDIHMIHVFYKYHITISNVYAPKRTLTKMPKITPCLKPFRYIFQPRPSHVV